MKAFLAIIAQTVRSAVRAKVFHILFVLVLLAVFLLPMTVWKFTLVEWLSPLGGVT